MATSREGDLLPSAREELLARIGAAQSRVWLCSPFLSGPIAGKIAAVAGAEDRRLLTALSDRSVRAGVLDPAGLAKLKAAGFEVRTRGGLHAKVSLVDEWGLVGSGNLTGRGLGGTEGANVELGVVLSSSQRVEAEALLGGWWERGKVVTDAEIARCESLEPYPTPRARPGEAGTPIAATGCEGLLPILAESAAEAASRGYWIDANYHQPDDENWWQRGWFSDGREIPNAIGDLAFIYLGRENDGPARCPAVVRVTRPSRLEREWVFEQRDLEAAERWPYVTKVEVVADLAASDGAELERIDKTGRSLRRGYCRISRAEFETLAAAMLAAV